MVTPYDQYSILLLSLILGLPSAKNVCFHSMIRHTWKLPSQKLLLLECQLYQTATNIIVMLAWQSYLLSKIYLQVHSERRQRKTNSQIFAQLKSNPTANDFLVQGHFTERIYSSHHFSWSWAINKTIRKTLLLGCLSIW